jgi:hypothetical protein
MQRMKMTNLGAEIARACTVTQSNKEMTGSHHEWFDAWKMPQT